MKPIGGFLPLESSPAAGAPYHQAPALSTGRACFRFVLEHLRPRMVRIPFFVCDALLTPLLRLRIPFRYYSLDRDLGPGVGAEGLGPEELLVLVHYFGIQGDRIREWSEAAGGHVIIDDSQAFFREGHVGTWSFNSVRKFFGLPDGAYLFGPVPEPFPTFPTAVPPIAHLQNRLVGKDKCAYEQFQNHESSLDDEFRTMSVVSASALAGLAYDHIAARRRANYAALERLLGDRNRLRLALGERDVPLYYPFLGRRPVRESLVQRGILVPKLWPELSSRSEKGFGWERELSSRLAPLPVDQRYDASAMETVAEAVIESLEPEDRPQK